VIATSRARGVAPDPNKSDSVAATAIRPNLALRRFQVVRLWVLRSKNQSKEPLWISRLDYPTVIISNSGNHVSAPNDFECRREPRNNLIRIQCDHTSLCHACTVSFTQSSLGACIQSVSSRSNSSQRVRRIVCDGSPVAWNRALSAPARTKMYGTFAGHPLFHVGIAIVDASGIRRNIFPVQVSNVRAYGQHKRQPCRWPLIHALPPMGHHPEERGLL